MIQICKKINNLSKKKIEILKQDNKEHINENELINIENNIA